MNCVTCAEKFTTVNALMQHVSEIRHSYQCSNFFCIPCSLPLHTMSNVIEHIGSEEHSIMAVATGIHFDTKAESSGNLGALFPPMFYCLLCSFRGRNALQQHVKSSTHSKRTSLLRAIISSKIIYCSNKKTDVKTREFIHKIINVKHKTRTYDSDVSSDSFDCELCNVYFNKPESYKQHLEDQSHKNMEQFMINLSAVVREMKIVGSDANVAETFSNSLPPLYYCELCCLWVETTISYVRHAKSITHTRIQELYNKLSNKRNREVITLRGCGGFARDSDFYFSKKYCKLCTVWGATGFRRHLKDAGHVKIEQFLSSLPNADDKKFLEVYINAQAQMKVGSSPPPNYCEFCNILYSRSLEYIRHLDSAEHKHVKKHYPKKKSTIDEKASKIIKTSTFTSIREERKISREAGDSTSSSEESGSNDQEHYCELCEFVCYNVLDYDKHLVGDEHKKMRRFLSKEVRKYSLLPPKSLRSSKPHPLQNKCELCDVFNPSPAKYERHLKSALHRENLRLLCVLKQTLF